MWRLLAALVLTLWAGRADLAARGGGGCVAAGTLIDTPDGPRPVETLHVGDIVWGQQSGQRVRATVQAVYAVAPAGFIELSTAAGTLRLTAEHPVQTAPGVFTRADTLAATTPLFTATNRTALTGLRRVPAEQPAYNLLVSPGGVFFANGLLVHNKGCFLPETPITLADGRQQAISQLRPGDRVLAFTAEGLPVATAVRRVLTHQVDNYLVVRTATTELHVTEEHPFYVGGGVFQTIDSLRLGDAVQAFDGTGRFTTQRILALERRRGPVKVYNLEVDSPHTFVASGIAVHNKGGGGGGGGSHGGGGYRSGHRSGGGNGEASPLVVLIVIGIFVFIIIQARNQRQASEDEDLDYCFARDAIEPKAAKTRKLLEFVARTDPSVAPAELEKLASATFRQLQECWSARAYEPMQSLLMPDLYEEHCAQLRGMRQTHEINKLENLRIEQVDLVHLHYPHREDERAFTALFTVWLRDYYVDDRTGQFLRGDTSPARFQEFWTFQRWEGSWRLREIEQTRESDCLKLENFFEPFTETGRDQVYGETAGKSGPAGPDLPPVIQAKDANIDRLLNFLVVTDRIWDREAMLTTARRTYLNVLLAWQDGRPEAFAGLTATPEMAAHLRRVNEGNQQRHWRPEYRNLCVRKVELVHINNRHDRHLDSFTARISAHAQVIVTQDGTVRHQDEFVKPWVEFWTFVRSDQLWVLQEILPGEKGAALIALENTDEGSSTEMLQWYYSKERAT